MSEWISVKDRLPLTDSEVYRFDQVAVIAFDGEDVFPCEFSAGNTISFWGRFDKINITHWQPLPSPPQDIE